MTMTTNTDWNWGQPSPSRDAGASPHRIERFGSLTREEVRAAIERLRLSPLAGQFPLFPLFISRNQMDELRFTFDKNGRPL